MFTWSQRCAPWNLDTDNKYKQVHSFKPWLDHSQEKNNWYPFGHVPWCSQNIWNATVMKKIPTPLLWELNHRWLVCISFLSRPSSLNFAIMKTGYGNGNCHAEVHYSKFPTTYNRIMIGIVHWGILNIHNVSAGPVFTWLVCHYSDRCFHCFYLWDYSKYGTI